MILTHGPPIHLVDMPWWLGNSLPEFTLHILNFPRFILGSNGNNQNPNMVVLNEVTFRALARPSPHH